MRPVATALAVSLLFPGLLPAQAQDEPVWHDAAKGQTIGDLRVTGKAHIAVPSIPIPEYLVVLVKIENLSEARKVDFSGWSLSAVVTDEHRNRYKLHQFGQEVPGSIYPGESRTEGVYCELPVKAAKKVRVRLPGDRIGLKEDFRIEFDATQIPVRKPPKK